MFFVLFVCVCVFLFAFFVVVVVVVVFFWAGDLEHCEEREGGGKGWRDRQTRQTNRQTKRSRGTDDASSSSMLASVINGSVSRSTVVSLLITLTWGNRVVYRRQSHHWCWSPEHRPLSTVRLTSTAALPTRQHSHSPDVLCLKTTVCNSTGLS